MKRGQIITMLVLILFISFLLSSRVFALGDWLTQGDDFIATGKSHAETEKDTIDTDLVDEGSDLIFNAFLAAGTVVAVIVGAILGIQFMTAGIEKKVEVKQALFPYIISCVVMFGAFGIWKIVVTIMNDVV